MQRLSDTLRREGKTIGFVPTMGFLHEGHLSLMRRARRDCDTVVASIFVNPTQFGQNEDLNRYPRDADGDRAKCEASGVDILFLPSVAEMYPIKPDVFIHVEGLSNILEGAIRPGHFQGVATVVSKLFHIAKPHAAYFGQKDYQQCVVIKRMASGLNHDVEIVVLPTMREADGLAMSSRNSYLNSDERRSSVAIHGALSAAASLAAAGERAPTRLKNAIQGLLLAEPGLQIDYIEFVDPETLAPLTMAADRMVVLVAVRLGRTRLLDNLIISS